MNNNLKHDVTQWNTCNGSLRQTLGLIKKILKISHISTNHADENYMQLSFHWNFYTNDYLDIIFFVNRVKSSVNLYGIHRKPQYKHNNMVVHVWQSGSSIVSIFIGQHTIKSSSTHLPLCGVSHHNLPALCVVSRYPHLLHILGAFDTQCFVNFIFLK